MNSRSIRCSVVVPNKPSDLARFTRFLLKEGVQPGGVRVASIGGKASVEFRLPRGQRIGRP